MAFKMKGFSGFKKPTKEWSKNDAGYDVKTTTRKNLFGRERTVEKYYDPETGEKLGKQVTVARGKNDPRADKVKIKKVNPGLTQSGGVGKIRLKKNPWDNPSGRTDPPNEGDGDGGSGNSGGNETNLNRAQRANQINIEEGGDFKVLSGDGGPGLEDYATSFGGFEIKDGKRFNPRNKKYYSDDEAGLKEYEDDAEAWWAEQARLTENEKLAKQNQEYGTDAEGNVKYKTVYNKRGYKMKRNRK